jgi:hypothetical protein
MKKDKKFTNDLNRLSDTCWICEGWQQIEFTFPSNILSNTNFRLYLHIDFLNYEPIITEKDKFQAQYNVTLMCPPATNL